MQAKYMKSILITILLATGACAMAGKPEWAGNGKQQKTREDAQQEVQIGVYFRDEQRESAFRYFGATQAKGNCPPGLAKKHNRCLPPGQAKKWAKGQPLASTVLQYPLPHEVVVKIGIPPSGYKYVRVANDILMVAVGTMVVVDAIEDLMK